MPACIPDQLLLSPNLDAASMLQEIKDRQSLKDFPKTKMLTPSTRSFHVQFSTIDSPGLEHTTPLLPLKYILSSDTLVPRKLVLAAIWWD
jgi:hypothetical protein